jgi:hypothetical protein
MKRCLVTACALALSALAPAAAQADWKAKAQGSRVVGEFDWWSTTNVDSLTWGVAAQLELIKTLYLDLELPLTYVTYDEPFEGDGIALGNITAGAHYADKFSKNFAGHVGGTLTVSTHLDPELSPTAAAQGLAVDDRTFSMERGALARAMFDMHRLYPGYLFLRPRAGIEVRFLHVFYYRGDISPVIWFPVGDTVDDVEFFIEQGNELEARADMGLGGGVRFQQVFPVSGLDFVAGDDDVVQTALEPYLTYEPERTHGLVARVGFLVALDESQGFGLDEGEEKVATLRVQIGGKW